MNKLLYYTNNYSMQIVNINGILFINNINGELLLAFFQIIKSLNRWILLLH